MKKGFTLAEILVTIGVLGILAAITIPTLVRSTIGNSMINKARVTQNQLAKVLQLVMALSMVLQNFIQVSLRKSFMMI